LKAVVVRAFAPFREASVDELPDPVPAAGEVVIDVKAAEVNYPDLLVMSGQYQNKPPLPFSPGKAATGVVSALGAGVTGFALGDRVAAQVEYGAYAEKLRAPAVNVYPLPAKLDFVAGAALGLAYQTAHFALVERARMRTAETVLVLGGAGGVGVAAIQLARALGAGKVVATARGPEKAEVARQAGADAVIDVADGELLERVRTELRRVAPGGADVVVDSVGGELSTAALRALAWRGRMVIVGFAAGTIPTIRANYLLVKNIEVSGLQWSDYRDRAPAEVARVQAELFALALAGKLDPIVRRTYPLADFRDALAAVDEGRVQGKIVLDLGCAPLHQAP
jgi:NADPH2:quinone reductase